MAKTEPDIHRKLIEKCRRGDAKSQYQLYKLYSKAMYNITIRLLANRMDAEDVLQEAFVAAFRKTGDFRGEAAFGAWLKRIVINHCIGFLKTRHQFTEGLERQHESISVGAWEHADHTYDPSTIHQAVKSLPEGARTVFSLYLLEGYRHQDIAGMLGISESTSKSQYQRAKTFLKEKLTKFSIKNTLYIPKTLSIEIDNKYSDINMESIAGTAGIKLYNGKLYVGSIGGKTALDLRYSKAYMEDVPVAKMDLYDSDIEMKNCGDFVIKSKYSKIEIGHAGNMIFDSYDDYFEIGKLGIFDGNAKYTDFILGPSSAMLFEFYDCNLRCGESRKIKGSGKYSEVFVGQATEVKLGYSYDDSYTFGKISSFSCPDSKYTDYEFESLTDSFMLNSYDDNITISELDEQFTEINFEGKYADLKIHISGQPAYILTVDQKYGKVEYPGEDFERKTYIHDNSKLFIEATTKGSSEEKSSKCQISGYDNKVLIAHE